MCRNYTLVSNKEEGFQELLRYVKREEIQESIRMYPSGGILKYRIPIILLKNGYVKVLFVIFDVLNKLKINISI